MSTRREARRIAIDILYQADVTGDDPALAWSHGWRRVARCRRSLASSSTGSPSTGLAIDLLLEEHTQDWTVARMAALDRTILRVAVEELRYRNDVPDSVAISEAVEAAVGAVVG